MNPLWLVDAQHVPIIGAAALFAHARMLRVQIRMHVRCRRVIATPNEDCRERGESALGPNGGG